MKITLNSNQWLEIGKKTGWIKEAQESPDGYTLSTFFDESGFDVDDRVAFQARYEKEIDDNTSRRRSIKVFFDNGDTLIQKLMEPYLKFANTTLNLNHKIMIRLTQKNCANQLVLNF